MIPVLFFSILFVKEELKIHFKNYKYHFLHLYQHRPLKVILFYNMASVMVFKVELIQFASYIAGAGLILFSEVQNLNAEKL